MSDIQDLLTEGESVQESTSPSIKDSRYIKGYILSVVLTVLFVGLAFSGLDLGFNSMYFLLLLVVPAALVLKSEIERKFVSYYITDNQVIMRRGILNRTTESTSYSNITDVTLNEALNERIFNVGDIRVNTAGHDGTTLVLNGLENPEKYKRMIESNINQSAGSQGGSSFGDGSFDNSGFDDSGFDGSGSGGGFDDSEFEF